MSARDDVLKKIYEVTSVTFDREEGSLKEEDEFEEDLKAKSANLSMMINQLEDEFDVEIPYLDFKRAKSIGGAADLIADLIEE